ncbi:hypothetical protein F5148DRAFT_1370168 [Russula earlei]|uniref:Uncharacterized protein n=1 Tax=Russula earlei TaxID=71964 RepID=A0ACC0TYI2_9AGAM|nr:hypothetical protein F5148DRAFT_1370168 [Russula earlei]
MYEHDHALLSIGGLYESNGFNVVRENGFWQLATKLTSSTAVIKLASYIAHSKNEAMTKTKECYSSRLILFHCHKRRSMAFPERPRTTPPVLASTRLALPRARVCPPTFHFLTAVVKPSPQVTGDTLVPSPASPCITEVDRRRSKSQCKIGVIAHIGSGREDIITAGHREDSVDDGIVENASG